MIPVVNCVVLSLPVTPQKKFFSRVYWCNSNFAATPHFNPYKFQPPQLHLTCSIAPQFSAKNETSTVRHQMHAQHLSLNPPAILHISVSGSDPCCEVRV
jgi:hypothetical protein